MDPVTDTACQVSEEMLQWQHKLNDMVTVYYWHDTTGTLTGHNSKGKTLHHHDTDITSRDGAIQ